ncbi:MAG: metallophosphoesterase [Acidilobus sp.]
MWEREIEAIDSAVNALRQLPLIVRVDNVGRIAVLGDVHGYADVVDRFEQLVDEFSADKAIMLGDYVDRGPNSIQTILKVLELVSAEPRKFIPLRGDHEDPRMNEGYGFYEEVLYAGATDLYSHVVEAYMNMPLAAVGLRSLMVHGGIPCVSCERPDRPALLSDIERYYAQVKGTRRYLELSDGIIFQMVWNDPSLEPYHFEPNIRGPGIYYYGRPAWSSFLRANGLNLIVRGHEVVDGLRILKGDGRLIEGIKCDSWTSLREVEGSVITVFSSRYHGGRAGSILIDSDGVTFKCL